jgi:drug/metabolite transporter (DMT)-like permease
MLLGVVFGLGSAILASASYLCSRVFTQRWPGSVLSLLALGHIIMGIFSAVLIVFFWPAHLPMTPWYRNLIFSVVCYFAGQASLMMALHNATASRVSPLLGLKILMLALIGISFMGQNFSPLQWAAIMLSLLAAGMLSATGEKLPFSSMCWILLSCFVFCFSDINIRLLMEHFSYLGLWPSSIVSVCLSYILCGIIGLAILPVIRRPAGAMWGMAAPFAVSWFGSMLLLFACFMLIGVVYGNIVQSTRGIISIMMGPVLAATGFEHIETHVPRRVFFQRLAAGLLMTAAIAMYQLDKR